MNFGALDLNLLKVLDALFAEGSVSRAAARLKLSQPATSNALGRLRHHLGDPLFVRSREGMVPTARALKLRGPLTEALRTLQAALVAPEPFDPRTARRTFVLAASDHAQLLVLPGLMARLAHCPGLRLRVVPLGRDFPTPQLEAGALDLVLGVFDLAPGDRVPKGLRRQRLVTERFVLVGRRGHPGLRRPLDLSRPQLHVAPRGGTESTADRRLKLKRNVVLYTPHYLVAPWVLASTDVLAALPERVAQAFAEAFPLTVVPLEVPHPPLQVVQVWHPVRHEEPAHRWLRALVLAAAHGATTSKSCASASS